MSDTRHWKIMEDGYHRQLIYVDTRTGKILGDVMGEPLSSSPEWDASIRGRKVPLLGSFVTERQAKEAVEAALQRKETQ